MTPASLIPIDGSGPSWEVFEILCNWLAEIPLQKHYDVQAGSDAVALIAAFAALEKQGTVEAFKERLLKPTQGRLHGPSSRSRNY